MTGQGFTRGKHSGKAFGYYAASDFSQFWHLALHTPP